MSFVYYVELVLVVGGWILDFFGLIGLFVPCVLRKTGTFVCPSQLMSIGYFIIRVVLMDVFDKVSII